MNNNQVQPPNNNQVQAPLRMEPQLTRAEKITNLFTTATAPLPGETIAEKIARIYRTRIE